MDIKPAIAEDAQKLARLAAQNDFSARWSAADFIAEIAQNTSLVLKAQNDAGDIIGFISHRFAPPYAELTNFAVAAANQRQGVGANLLQKSLAILKQKGVGALTLEVNINNSAAAALYKKSGFTQTAIRKKFYNDTDDALILRREL